MLSLHVSRSVMSENYLKTKSGYGIAPATLEEVKAMGVVAHCQSRKIPRDPRQRESWPVVRSGMKFRNDELMSHHGKKL